jgi:hypothetical protein
MWVYVYVCFGLTLQHKAELDLQRSAILLEAERARTQELRAQVEDERTRSMEVQRECGELRLLLQRAYVAMGPDTRLNSTRINSQPALYSMPPPVMNTPMRQQYPIVDHVRRRLAELNEKDKV